MYVLLVFAIVVIGVYAEKFLRNYIYIVRLAARTPTVSGALPLIGHLHKLCGSSNEKLFEYIDVTSRETNREGGVTKFWFGPSPLFVLTDPEDVRKAMNTSVEKSYFYSFADSWIRSSLLLATTAIWKSRIKIVQPAFTNRTTLGFLEIFNEESRLLLENLSTVAGRGPFQHYAMMSNITMKSIFQSAFGMKLEDNNMYHQYQAAHENVTKRLVARFRSLWLYLDIVYQFSKMKKEENDDMRVLHGTSRKVLMKAKEMYSGRANSPDEIRTKPFLESMLQSNNEGRLSDDEMQAELSLIIGAGYETTSLTLSFILILLGSHPEIQDNLYEELKRVFESTDRNVTKQDLPRLVYLEAVIKEGLRLYPVIPMISRELHSDVHLKNYTLPSGSNIVISFWGLNRDPKLWGEDVDAFRPERWLNGSLPKILTGGASFGLGKRGCVGKIYAMTSIKTSLAHILRRYKISASKESPKLQMNVALHTTEPVSISVDRR